MINMARNRNRTRGNGTQGSKVPATSNSKLMKLASAVGGAQPIGLPFPQWSIQKTAEESGTGPLKMNNNGMYQPGIMTMGIWLNPGISEDGASAINIAGKNLFANMRKYNTGYAPYEQSDVTMYLYAFTSALAMHAEFTRALGLTNLPRSATLRYVPKVLVESLGYDYDDLIENKRKLATQLEKFAEALNTFFIPALPYVQAATAYVSTVFTENQGDYGQMYAFGLTHSYQWNETPTQGGTPYLQPVVMPYFNASQNHFDKLATYSDIKSLMTNVKESLLASTTYTFISSDLSKTGMNSVQVASYDEQYVCNPVYSEEMLRKITNLRIAPDPALKADSSGKITANRVEQEVGVGIIYRPKFSKITPDSMVNPEGLWLLMAPATLDMNKDSWTDEDTASALELSFPAVITANTGGSTGDPEIIVNHIPPIMACCAYIIIPQGDTVIDSGTIPVNVGYFDGDGVSAMNSIAGMSNFSGAPHLPIAGKTNGSDGMTVTVRCYTGDTTRLQIVPNETLQEMIDARLWGYFGLPDTFGLQH
nr:putative capsid [Marmot picobirnavirus]AVX53732.1 putative capsid [Marmot picobirnavirus]